MHWLFRFSALLAFPLNLLVDLNLTPAQNHELSEFSVQWVFDSAYYITIFVQYSFFQRIYKDSVYLNTVLLALIQNFFVKCYYGCWHDFPKNNLKNLTKFSAVLSHLKYIVHIFTNSFEYEYVRIFSPSGFKNICKFLAGGSVSLIPLCYDSLVGTCTFGSKMRYY